MKNFIQPGEVMTYAHSGAKNSGDPVKIGSLLGVASADYAANEAGEYAISGVFEITKLTSDDVAIGAQLYWDDGNSRLTTTASTHIKAGRAFKAAGTSATKVQILLNSNG
jgi:predicted RecA/RadA family phage recombinase